MQNCHTGNVSSNLVFETKRMSILCFTISFRASNLFLIEFMFMWQIITLNGLLFLNSYKVENEIPSNCLLG